MCLSVPGKVVEIGEGRIVLEYPGEERVVEVSLVDLVVGDYVIVAGGVVVSKVDEGKVKKFMELLDD